MRSPLRVLHVEVGGTYGGSLAALETYIAFSNKKRFHHTVLLYYPTPNTARLSAQADELIFAHLPLPRHLRKAVTPLCAGQRTLPRLAFKSQSIRRLAAVQDYCIALRTAMALRGPLLRRDFDVVHINNTFTYQLPTYLALYDCRRPLISHVRNPVKPTCVARRLARRSTCVVTVARVYEALLKKWPSPPCVITCYDGIARPAPDAHTVCSLRERLLVRGDWLVGSAGRLETQKGYEWFIRAARRVADRSSAVQFVIAGDGPLRGYLEALIKELKLEDHCRILGFRSDVEEFLDALDIFVSPSLWEGLPTTLIQALMLGKPVVATSVGGVPEVIPQRHAGTLVPPADDKALACAIVRALENRDEVVASLEQSYQLARRLFDPHTQALALDGIFEAFAS